MKSQLHEKYIVTVEITANILQVMISGADTHTHTHFPTRKRNKEFVSGLT